MRTMKVSAKIMLLVIPLVPALFIAGFASNRMISSLDVLFLAYFPCLVTYVFGVFTGERNIKEKYKHLFDKVE
jgi:hypothetical protein